MAGSNELPPLDYAKEFIDDVGYPFLFNNYSNLDYATFHAEDWPELSTFNYAMRGFRNPPTDHYIRPLLLAMRKLKPLQYTMDQIFMYLEDKKLSFKASSALCYESRPKHKVMIDYLKRFIHSYRGKRKFAMSWLNEIGHDYVSFLELGDEDTMQFFKWMQSEGHLNNTVLLFMSDHGARIEKIRNTPVGRIEDRMPFLGIVLPPHLKTKYPHIHRNMLVNTKRLTVPYDVYAFLSDVLNRNFREHNSLEHNKKLPRGISLFRDIPKKRTCADAAIPENYCACHSETSIDVKSKHIQDIAQFIVRDVNEYLKNHQHICAKLRVGKVVEASLVSSGLKRVPDEEEFTLRKYFYKPSLDQERRYLILLETIPGEALFEGMVSRWENTSLSLLGKVVRTNRYGNQSICINKKGLRPYCYCSKS